MEIKDAVIRVVDCETTGLDPKEHSVVEIACVDMSYKEGIIDSTSFLINPERKISLESMAVHHITDEMVRGAPRIDVVWPTLQDGNFHAMAAHNAQFDFSFLKTNLPVICSLRVARHLWSDLDSYKNQYLRYYLGVNINSDMQMHRALGENPIVIQGAYHNLE